MGELSADRSSDSELIDESAAVDVYDFENLVHVADGLVFGNRPIDDLQVFLAGFDKFEDAVEK